MKNVHAKTGALRQSGRNGTGPFACAALLLWAAGCLLAGCEGGLPRRPPPSPPVREIPESGGKLQDCGHCPQLVVVAKDEEFVIGSPAGEAGRESDEGVRSAGIAAAFAVGVYEVTFAQWDACVAGGGCSHRPDDRGWGRGTRPVIDVNRDDARAYVAWLSSTTGKRYRLLSEAEWEYVARAGTSTPFHTGASIAPQQANYDWRVAYGAGATQASHPGQTQAVGSYAANAFGLYDVHGNVAELVDDCYEGDCTKRVVRGGSWADAPQYLRSAYRGWCPPTLRNDRNGFRVARALDETP